MTFIPSTISENGDNQVLESRFRGFPVITNQKTGKGYTTYLCTVENVPSDVCVDCSEREDCIAYTAYKRKEG